MRAKSVVLILIALGCGLVASIGISQVLQRGGPETAVETVEIYVAKVDVDINSKLTADSVRLEAWPKDRVPLGAITQLDQIEGQYTRQRLYVSEPLLTQKLANTVDAPSVDIPKGYRVTTVKVQVDEGGGGLVNPGDRVDIIAFLRKSGEVQQTMTRTILRAVRVFAVNADTERVDEQGTGKTYSIKTLSLLVKNKQVETLTLAAHLGSLRMSLRRPDDEEEEDGTGEATIGDLVGNAPEKADDKKGSGPLGDLLSQQTPPVSQPQPSYPAAIHEMVVMGPDGVQTFRWTDPNRLPVQVSNGEGDPTGSPTVETFGTDPSGEPVEETVEE